MEKKKKVDWSALPKELWLTIGNCLDSRIDVLRFRSVCTLWRSSVPPFKQTTVPPLPHKFSSDAVAAGAEFQALLFQTTVYRMQPLVDGEPNSSNSKPWLLKLEESNSGESRLLHPITNSPLRYSPKAKNFNLLDFGVVELRKSYSLKYRQNNVIIACVNKVVVMGQTHLDNCGIFKIFDGGKLGYLRIGDEKWTHFDERNSHYDDIIVYKGQCYVVDRLGTIFWVSSELKVVPFSPPLCGFGGQKHLVESCGDLYVVDRCLDRERSERYHLEDNNVIFGLHNPVHPNPFFANAAVPEAIDFKVYKLDQEWARWVDVKNLGDQVFILSNDGSFSVSTRGLARVKGNCILFTDHRHAHLPGVAGSGARKCHSCVFDLEDGSIKNVAAFRACFMLWPPSSWLSPD
ncbi:hypothetical protein PRUPE_7G177400 [Prunus persica]|uniref:KIB1-4 beta-propeller domain-containing protein n=1 Tax=Prunus persica TaxID=3760 RepID=A0A251ND19_PRUPE|nr:putative F-box protein At1g65770 [Prunus persica]ONH97221.1 hypothetical protein PRUPE_7G177400 [Prunus persica]ONH97222.1 hypothetical protein PRUPE_7G177400 [Prunus persica]